MLVSKLSCPKCGATLRPPSPLPAGKRARCPKCSEVFTVTAPEDADEEESQSSQQRINTASKARASRTRPDDDEEDDLDEDESEALPRRKISAVEDEDDEAEEEDEDRPRKKKKKRFKKKKSGANVGLILGIIGGSLAGVVGIFLVVYFLIIPLFGNNIQRGIKLLNEAADILGTVKDQASADAAKPKLVNVGQKLAKLRRELGMEKAGEELKEKDKKAIDEAGQRLLRESFRVSLLPGGRNLIMEFDRAMKSPP